MEATDLQKDRGKGQGWCWEGYPSSQDGGVCISLMSDFCWGKGWCPLSKLGREDLCIAFKTKKKGDSW